jgi:tetratricopeptide (TPR) repeat protein
LGNGLRAGTTITGAEGPHKTMRMRLFGAAVLAMAACAGWANVKLTVNAQNGQAIKGTQSFRATAQSEKLVTSVEFYVNDSLRGTDESTPYEFTIDSLQEDDGDLTLRFDAYTEDGDKGTVTLKIKVDNGVALGLQHHVDKGLEALSESRWDDAIFSGRVALKVDEKSVDAKAILARANYGKGVKDLAQKYLEDVLAIDPNNSQAIMLLSAIQIDLAFDSIAANPNARADTIAQISSSLKKAAEGRAKTLNLALDAISTDVPVSDPKRISALMEASRYNAIIQTLTPLSEGDRPSSQLMNSLIYALIRNGQFGKAAVTMRRYERFGSPDGYGFALKAILMQYAGLEKEARDAEKEALLSDPSSPAVKTAQAYMALKRGDSKVFGQIANDLGQTEAPAHISGYFVSSLLLQAGEFQRSLDSIRAALKSEPAAYDIYIERACQILIYSFTEGLATDEAKAQRDTAVAFLDAALAIKPESFQALTCLSLINGLQGNVDKAVSYGQAATKAGPEYGPAWFALSAALNKQKSGTGAAKAAVDEAAKVDPYNFRGRTIPTFETAWRYYYQHGRMPLMPNP